MNATHLERARGIAAGLDVLLETGDVDSAGRVLNLALREEYGLSFPEEPEHENFFSSSRRASSAPEAYRDLEDAFSPLNALDYELYEFLRARRDAIFARLGVAPRAASG